MSVNVREIKFSGPLRDCPAKNPKSNVLFLPVELFIQALDGACVAQSAIHMYIKLVLMLSLSKSDVLSQPLAAHLDTEDTV